jgi:CRISPR-associated endonuclease/helicase Cas3
LFLKEIFPEIPIMLIHSRFKRGDRVALETRLKTEFNGDGSKEFADGLMPCLVISTQVVEVSLDISFDRMITQAAPLDGLIQRFGRVNRKRNKDTIGKYRPVHIIKPQGNVLPYKMDILRASYEQLPDNFEVLEEKALQEKIDNVFLHWKQRILIFISFTTMVHIQ